MSIEKLKGILFPPDPPFKTGDEEGWNQVESQLGTTLPIDYKEIISTYGTGGIDEFLWFLTPFVDDENVNFFKKMKVINDAYIVLRDQFPHHLKHNVFPEENGLLPWAYTDNGDVLYWLTKGSPDEWSIVIYGSSDDYYEYPNSISEFLYDMLSRKIVCDIFPDDFPDENPKYYAIEVD